MKIKLIADVHISPITVTELKASGYHIKRVTDYLPAYAKDSEIVELAIKQEAVIISQDLDFSAIVAQREITKPSIISLRVGNAKPHIISKILLTILPQIEKELKDGAIVSVEENQYRLRKLPI
jgi:predicted nuclease of predicted toxin-antitoxin system